MKHAWKYWEQAPINGVLTTVMQLFLNMMFC